MVYISFFYSSINVTNNDCLSLTNDEHGNLKPISVQRTNCSGPYKYCYNITDTKYCESSKLKVHQSIILCRNENNEWYPEMLLSKTKSSKDCNRIEYENTLNDYSDRIEYNIDNTNCKERYEPPVCKSLRCSLGKCLDQKQICDGKKDCHNNYDESVEICKIHKQECSKSELKCRNGKCVPKTKFCDHYNDCGDHTDEPLICSCFSYLQ